MASPREHIEEIRRKKFSIGGEENPLSEDLHQAVKNLSAELYAKDVHFLMELIQNAEDNEYSESVDPSLEFVIISNDITATGAPATLLIFNNEIGFSRKNIDSICSVGRSTKKENRKKGYIGEKGIGFKSVFLITSTPYIFSSGYQLRFNEEPCDHCGLGYVVPEWVEQNPTLSQINQVYGSSTIPTTTLVLPLKADKVTAVTSQLSSIHPQVLLFLSKIKRLSVRSGLCSVTEVAIVKETDYAQRKNIDAESFTIHLAAGPDSPCSFYMWRQKFPVPASCRVDRRSGVDMWTIVLAFPLGDSSAVKKSPGIYAFLPTEMVTGFPFVIQADFVLSSSRETILLDCPWNRGILGRVPHAFSDAFKSLVTANPDVPLSTLPGIFRHLPVEPSSYPELNAAVRDGIQALLADQHVVPSEPAAEQRLFHRPREVGRLLLAFWTVLARARRDGVSLSSLSSHGKFVLAGCFDREENDRFLEFLGIKAVDREWYGKCIQGSRIVDGVSEPGYIELLSFAASHWGELGATNLRNIPLLKYEGLSGRVSLTSVAGSALNQDGSVFLSSQPGEAEWLIEWNRELGCPGSRFFVPKAIQDAIQSSPNRALLLQWLQNHTKIEAVDVSEYAGLLCGSLRERRLLVSYTHFLYHSTAKKGFLTEATADHLCSQMPVVDNYGTVVRSRNGVLVPAKGSKWAVLVGSNAWRSLGYVELSEDYLSPAKLSRENELAEFLRDRAKAEDVPSVPIPDSRIATAGSPLTRHNAFLLLDWIRNRRGTRLPARFVESVSEGSWLRITVKGCSGFRPPCESFLLDSSSQSWASLLQSGSVLIDIPLIDRSYYGGNAIDGYAAELRAVGVKSEYSEACEFIGNRLMSLAGSGNLTRENVLSILGFIAFLRKQCLPPKDFIDSVKDGKWLRTCLGDKSPQESVWYDDTWRVTLEISDIPFVDIEHYGRSDIIRYKDELELLGVAGSFTAGHYQFMADRLKPSRNLASLSSQALVTLLLCIYLETSSEKVVRALTGTPCLKTSSGYRYPGGSVLCEPTWACLLQIFDAIPLVDSAYYGSQIFNLKPQLQRIGVVVDFEHAVKEFTRYFRDCASSRSVSKEKVMSLLSVYRKFHEPDTALLVPSDLKDCLREQKWLRTRHCDYLRSPKECILYSSDWEAISPIATLPFIDDTDNWYGKSVHAYQKELKSMGVVVDFKAAAGTKFVANGLLNFRNVDTVSRETALALLDCIQILSKEKDYKLPDDFTKKLSQPWMKTYLGYRPPQECLLFDSKFADAGLKKTDGPFVDEGFYGPNLGDYRGVLASIGVIVEAEKGSLLIASELESQTEFSKILRLYEYLAKYNWEPKSDTDKKIWIPTGSHTGKWVSPGDCVVHDNSGLFGSQLTVLDKHYKYKTNLFSSIFKVKLSPDTEDYCRLWRTWEESDQSLSNEECCKFWGYIAKHCSSKTEKNNLPEKFVKVPVMPRDGGSNGISLAKKSDVFIADDLQLKSLFDQSSSLPIFVWYPQPASPALSRANLLRVFQKLGVRTISESVQREEESSAANDRRSIPSSNLIGRVLVKLILGFLAVGMEAEERHRAIGDLLRLSVVETEEPIEVGYNLSLSSGESVSVRARRSVRWERESSTILTQRTAEGEGSSPCHVIERGTYFSEVVAEGLLWENGERVHELAELLKTAFLLNFDDAAVEFLMKSKNLQIYEEDEKFLASAFPSPPR